MTSVIKAPAARVYGFAVEARNRRFERGLGVRRMNVPVISVGNITVGGVGKTPFVRHLSRMLIDEGHAPVIAMRGYAPWRLLERRAKGGRRSDEQVEHVESLPGIEVVADPDRVRALGEFLPLHPEIDCVLLDDGFQHRQLHRDLDLVLISARQSLRDRLLPAGALREPPESLRRASAVVVTHAPSAIAPLRAAVEALHGRPPVAWTRHVWRALRVRSPDGGERAVDPGWLQDRRVLPVLAVGDPESILEQLRREGAVVGEGLIRRDHAHFNRRALDGVYRRAEVADAVVMTGKDWVRTRDLIDFSRCPVPIIVPELEIDVFQGAQALRDLVLTTLRPGRH